MRKIAVLITLTSTATSASDLSHLLRKHPARAQPFQLAVGRAHVFYPEASDERCTVALLLDVDPVSLVRDKRFRGGGGSSLAPYVNDRPYASSWMVVKPSAGEPTWRVHQAVFGVLAMESEPVDPRR